MLICSLSQTSVSGLCYPLCTISPAGWSLSDSLTLPKGPPPITIAPPVQHGGVAARIVPVKMTISSSMSDYSQQQSSVCGWKSCPIYSTGTRTTWLIALLGVRLALPTAELSYNETGAGNAHPRITVTFHSSPMHREAGMFMLIDYSGCDSAYTMEQML